MALPVVIDCIKGRSAHREVLLGFATADLLCKLSFPDTFDEDSGQGYQRPFNERHSLDFRRYIKTKSSSTIPLTLNLRPTDSRVWRIRKLDDVRVQLEISPGATNIMTQVDCQHRLGHLSDLPVSLPFMCFVGLSDKEEMEVFSIINGKAKGLSTSLLDYHASKLTDSLAEERPELFIALQLNSMEESPWFSRLNLGGKRTSGLRRIVSLRMMQQATNKFLKATDILSSCSAEEAVIVLFDFWSVVKTVLPDEWENPRRNMLAKGIGVYSLTQIAADIYVECRDAGEPCDRRVFASALADFANTVDWSTSGPLKGFGGQGGVKAAVEFLRDARNQTRYKVVNG